MHDPDTNPLSRAFMHLWVSSFGIFGTPCISDEQQLPWDVG